MDNPGEPAQELSVFISHRHKDERVADVFRSKIKQWSNDQVGVFQSSNAGSGLQLGENLDSALCDAVALSNLVIFIYTDPNKDWSWCMYECGLAQDPRSMNTRIVVFHCTEEIPEPLRHLVQVPMSPEGIASFTIGFHRDPHFFPRFDKSLYPDISDETLAERSEELYEELRHVVPDHRATENLRGDRFTIVMSIDDVRATIDAEEAEDFDAAHAYVRETLTKQCLVRRPLGDPYAHFNLQINDTSGDVEFKKALQQWEKLSRHPEIEWRKRLSADITRSILQQPPAPTALPFDSVEPGSDIWLLPMLVASRRVPDENNMEFDVLLYQLLPATAMAVIDSERGAEESGHKPGKGDRKKKKKEKKEKK